MSLTVTHTTAPSHSHVLHDNDERMMLTLLSVIVPVTLMVTSIEPISRSLGSVANKRVVPPSIKVSKAILTHHYIKYKNNNIVIII